MKKIFVLIAAAIVTVSAMAQVQFGAKVGVDATNFWGKDVKHGMQFNYQAGLVMEYKFTPTFAIAPEAVFAAQGGKFDAVDFHMGDMSFNKEVAYHTNYINVPVMFKFYTSPSFSLDFGPQVGFNVYSKYALEDLDAVDIKDATKSVDFGIGVGGTYNLTDNAFVQARYTMGMTNVFEGDGDIKNGNVQLAFGMKF
jgi:hypothetical protein